MPKKPPTSLRILKVRRSRKSISIDYRNGDESHGITSRDNPLPAFTKALDALPPLVCELLGLPDAYAENMKAKGLTLSDGDNELVTVVAEKYLNDANGPFNIATPLRFMELPKAEGSYSPKLTDKQVALIEEVIEQAKAYALGERAQGQIQFEGVEDDEGEGEPANDPASNVEPLPGMAEEPTAPKKRSRRSAAGK